MTEQNDMSQAVTGQENVLQNHWNRNMSDLIEIVENIYGDDIATPHDAICALLDENNRLETELLAAQRKVVEQEALLMWVLWHTQGGSSIVGHRMRKYLGVGEFAHLTEAQVAIAKTAGD